VRHDGKTHTPAERPEIDPDATVFDALAKMAEKDVGSLVVMDREKIDRHHHRETLFAEGDSQGQNVPYHAG
jgi:CBS domain-containing protein